MEQKHIRAYKKQIIIWIKVNQKWEKGAENTDKMQKNSKVIKKYKKSLVIDYFVNVSLINL